MKQFDLEVVQNLYLSNWESWYRTAKTGNFSTLDYHGVQFETKDWEKGYDGDFINTYQLERLKLMVKFQSDSCRVYRYKGNYEIIYFYEMEVDGKSVTWIHHEYK